MGMAQLKPRMGGHRQGGYRHLPCLQGHGPIEATTFAPRGDMVIPYHVFSDMAPLKQRTAA